MLFIDILIALKTIYEAITIFMGTIVCAEDTKKLNVPLNWRHVDGAKQTINKYF